MLQWEHLSQATDRQLNKTQANGDKGNTKTGTSYTDTFDLSSLVSVLTVLLEKGISLLIYSFV